MTNRFDGHVAMVTGAGRGFGRATRSGWHGYDQRCVAPGRADPKYWAPFVVVGEPAKALN